MSPHRRQAPEDPPRTIIAVDASLPGRQALREALEGACDDLRVAVYGDVAQALEAVRFFSPSAVVVVLDGEGWDALGQLRTMVTAMPVVALGSDPDALGPAITAGATAYLPRSAPAPVILRACGL